MAYLWTPPLSGEYLSGLRTSQGLSSQSLSTQLLLSPLSRKLARNKHEKAHCCRERRRRGGGRCDERPPGAPRPLLRSGAEAQRDVHDDCGTRRVARNAIKTLGLDASPALAVFRTDAVQADLPAGKQLPFLYSTKDVPPAPPMGYTAPTPPAEETPPRASYESDPALIQLVGVLCLIGGCLGLVVYAILSIDE